MVINGHGIDGMIQGKNAQIDKLQANVAHSIETVAYIQHIAQIGQVEQDVSCRSVADIILYM